MSATAVIDAATVDAAAPSSTWRAMDYEDIQDIRRRRGSVHHAAMDAAIDAAAENATANAAEDLAQDAAVIQDLRRRRDLAALAAEEEAALVLQRRKLTALAADGETEHSTYAAFSKGDGASDDASVTESQDFVSFSGRPQMRRSKEFFDFVRFYPEYPDGLKKCIRSVWCVTSSMMMHGALADSPFGFVTIAVIIMVQFG